MVITYNFSNGKVLYPSTSKDQDVNQVLWGLLHNGWEIVAARGTEAGLLGIITLKLKTS
jgi:hypothetical protein